MNPPPTPPPESYDDVRYPSVVHPQTHPERLAAIATLFGMDPAPPARCRVLELGCGDGANVIAMGFAYPGCKCVGIDTSAAAIADGQKVVDDLGLGNVTLERRDVMDVSAGLGQFDYIIAHGLYSWVPPNVREKVLTIAKENLAPGGVAYVSYNVYPAGHLRLMLRGMMRYHAARFANPREQLAQARGLLKFVADAAPRPGATPPSGQKGPTRHELYGQFIRMELERQSTMPEGFLIHDELATYNEPVYFHEFAALAAGQRLQYLAEADFWETQPPVPGAPSSMPPDVVRMLDQIPGGDIVAREQYADFVKCRQFRQTLLCHADVRLQRPANAKRVSTLYASSAAQPVSKNPDLRPNVVENFAMPGGPGTISTASTVAKAAMLELAAAWPRRLHFDELRERWQQRAGAAAGADSNAVADLLLAGFAANAIGLFADAPALAVTPGERPMASALARSQARRGAMLTNLNGTTVQVTGEMAPRLLQLLDGTRDRDALAADLAAGCRRDGLAFERDGRRVTEPAEMAAILRPDLDAKLNSLAQLALLVS